MRATTTKKAAPRARAASGGTKARTGIATKGRTAPGSKAMAAGGTKRAAPLPVGANGFIQQTKNALRAFSPETQKQIFGALTTASKGWSFPLQAARTPTKAATATATAARKAPALARTGMKAQGAGTKGRTTPARSRSRSGSAQNEAPMPQQAGTTSEQIAH